MRLIRVILLVSGLWAMQAMGDVIQKKTLPGAGDLDAPLHFRPAEPGRFGDAIPFYHEGTYHVFYLLDGCGRWGWEHRVSKDLIRWEQMPRAIEPGPPGAPDEGCGTGSVVYDTKTKTWHLFYTGFNGANAFDSYQPGRGHPDGGQQIMHAVSKNGIQWLKQPHDTFVGDGVHYHNLHQGPFLSGNHMCRDPYVRWNEKEQVWDMVFVAETAAATGKQRPVFGRAVSKDLVKWSQVDPLKNARPGDCPDLFELKGRWYLICDYCRWCSADQPTGPFGAEQVSDTETLGVPKRMYDGKRQILVGWIRDYEGQDDRGSLGGFGTQCLPRELYAGPEGDLYCRPVAELGGLYKVTVNSLKDKIITPDAPLSWNAPPDYLLDMTLMFTRSEADSEVAIRLRYNGGDTGYRLVFKPGCDLVGIAGPKYHYSRKGHVDWRKPVKVQVFVEGSIIECFVNDADAFSLRAYNWHGGGIGVSSQHADVRLIGASVKTLR